MDHPGAGAAFRHEPDPLEPREVARDGGLADRSQRAEVVDTTVPAAERIEHLHADGVAQRFQDFGPGFGR